MFIVLTQTSKVDQFTGGRVCSSVDFFYWSKQVYNQGLTFLFFSCFNRIPMTINGMIIYNNDCLFHLENSQTKETKDYQKIQSQRNKN